MTHCTRQLILNVNQAHIIHLDHAFLNASCGWKLADVICKLPDGVPFTPLHQCQLSRRPCSRTPPSAAAPLAGPQRLQSKADKAWNTHVSCVRWRCTHMAGQSTYLNFQALEKEGIETPLAM